MVTPRGRRTPEGPPRPRKGTKPTSRGPPPGSSIAGGATVNGLCASWVQQQRGHIGIEAIVGLLPARVNHLRRTLVDIACGLFCGFFAWKSWKLLHEAWVDGQTTTSSWAPPLWIPYGIMTLGMTLLTLQIALQLWPRRRAERRAAPKPARVPPGDRPTYPSDEGRQ